MIGSQLVKYEILDFLKISYTVEHLKLDSQTIACILNPNV